MKRHPLAFFLCLLLTGCFFQTTPKVPPETATIMPTATINPILFVDDFSNPKSGWTEGYTENGKYLYGDGFYLISGTKTESKTVSIYEDHPLVDGVYTMEYKITSGDQKNTGVLFYWHVQDNNSFYFLQIWGNGYYALGKYVDGAMSQITGVRKSDFINAGYIENKVTIAIHDRITDIYFNDNYETLFFDSSLRNGDIGLGVFPDHLSGVQAEFDNVAVYHYDPTNKYTPKKPDTTPIPSFRSITRQELIEFLVVDYTNWNKYIPGKYDCTNFSIDLVENARRQNLKAWFVSVHFAGQETGHAFTAFETSDHGIVFVDPQGDNTYSNITIGSDLCDDGGENICFGIVESIKYKECDQDENCSPYIP